MPITVEEVTALATYSVRHPVLRAGRPLEDCAMQGDELASTFHLAAIENEQAMGVATFLRANDDTILTHCGNDLSYYQLRGMAVLPAAQGMGIGRMLLLDGINRLKSLSIDILWFNARIAAVPFYEKLGFVIIGSSFEVEKIGTHFKMYRSL